MPPHCVEDDQTTASPAGPVLPEASGAHPFRPAHRGRRGVFLSLMGIAAGTVAPAQRCWRRRSSPRRSSQ